jgi:hypothetical protein
MSLKKAWKSPASAIKKYILKFQSVRWEILPEVFGESET